MILLPVIDRLSFVSNILHAGRFVGLLVVFCALFTNSKMAVNYMDKYFSPGQRHYYRMYKETIERGRSILRENVQNWRDAKQLLETGVFMSKKLVFSHPEICPDLDRFNTEMELECTELTEFVTAAQQWLKGQKTVPDMESGLRGYQERRKCLQETLTELFGVRDPGTGGRLYSRENDEQIENNVEAMKDLTDTIMKTESALIQAHKDVEAARKVLERLNSS